MISTTITSNYCKKDFHYSIIGPTDISEEIDVLYVQDGGDYLELGAFEKTYKNIAEKYPEAARKWTSVLISPGTSEERWHSYSRNGAFFQNYLSFFTNEFIPEIEKNFNSIRKRGLLGDSLGANISLNIAMQEPAKWTHLLLQSAAVSIADLQQLQQTGSLTWNVYQTVGIYEDEFVSTISKERLYIYTRNQELHRIFQNKHTHIEYVEKEEHHLWEFWKRNLSEALEFFVNR